MRQTLLKKYAKIRSDMERLHNSRMSPYETMECHEAIRSEVAACWRTDEIRRTKPTPQVGACPGPACALSAAGRSCSAEGRKRLASTPAGLWGRP